MKRSISVSLTVGVVMAALAVAAIGGAAMAQEENKGTDAAETECIVPDEPIAATALSTEENPDGDAVEAECVVPGEAAEAEQIVRDESTIVTMWLDASGEEGTQTFTITPDETGASHAASDPSTGSVEITEDPAKP